MLNIGFGNHEEIAMVLAAFDSVGVPPVAAIPASAALGGDGC
ncbi:MAG: hypothetical protein RKP20_16050 [Candidatus Competibacter sp.]|nr:hypothetical protein [Candidatus Competibacter sp.]